MRRIVAAAMSTLAALVLLFSYHTSLGGGSTPVAAAPVATGPAVPGPSASPAPSTEPSAEPTTGDDSGDDDTGSSSTAAPAPSTSTSSAASSAAKTYTGDAVDTRWGVVQVQITVADGKITKADAVQYPQNNGRDIEINSYAVPQLNTEAVQAGNARIDAVSGATVTSDGYIQSLQSAVDQAHL
jgi:uncharacterized protein with FMN-binding domain